MSNFTKSCTFDREASSRWPLLFSKSSPSPPLFFSGSSLWLPYSFDSCLKPPRLAESTSQTDSANPKNHQYSPLLILRRRPSLAWGFGGWRDEFKAPRKKARSIVVKNFRKRKKLLTGGAEGCVAYSQSCVDRQDSGGVSSLMAGRVWLEVHKIGFSSLENNGISPSTYTSVAVTTTYRSVRILPNLILSICFTISMKSLGLTVVLAYLLCLALNVTSYWCRKKYVVEVNSSPPLTSRKGFEQTVEIGASVVPISIIDGNVIPMESSIETLCPVRGVGKLDPHLKLKSRKGNKNYEMFQSEGTSFPSDVYNPIDAECYLSKDIAPAFGTLAGRVVEEACLVDLTLTALKCNGASIPHDAKMEPFVMDSLVTNCNTIDDYDDCSNRASETAVVVFSRAVLEGTINDRHILFDPP